MVLVASVEVTPPQKQIATQRAKACQARQHEQPPGFFTRRRVWQIASRVVVGLPRLRTQRLLARRELRIVSDTDRGHVWIAKRR